MMLGDLINQYAATEANAGQWQDVVDILSTPTIVRNNDTAWTLGMIGTQLGLETAGLIAGVMQAAGASNPLINSAYIAISTVGLQLSSDDRQMMIGTIGTVGGLTSQQVDAIKRLGRVVTSPLEDAGLPVPSAGEVQQAWAEVLFSREWTTLQNEVIGPASGNRTALVAALRQAADELEAG